MGGAIPKTVSPYPTQARNSGRAKHCLGNGASVAAMCKGDIRRRRRTLCVSRETRLCRGHMHTICTLSQKWSARPGLTILITTCGDSTYLSAPPGTRTPNLLIKSKSVQPSQESRGVPPSIRINPSNTNIYFNITCISR